MKAQALVEFALILPILLLLILGLMQVSFAMLTSLRLTHAAQQAAAVGAAQQAVPQRCARALEAVSQVYGSDPDEAHCVQPGHVIEIRLTDAAQSIGPWGTWNIRAVGRAVTGP